MLRITDRAKQELSKILTSNVEMPQARLRICDRGQGELGIGIDIEEPDDRVVEYRGSRILVIKRQLENRLKHITIDIDETTGGPQLVICGDYSG